MPEDSLSFEPATVAQLACPACHGSLRIAAARLVCVDCGRAYPVCDGIPVLIVEHAEPATHPRNLPEA